MIFMPTFELAIITTILTNFIKTSYKKFKIKPDKLSKEKEK